jgi:hypothetical protein
MNFTLCHCCTPGLSMQKKEWRFFVYFGTHNHKIHTIYKQTSVLVFFNFFHVVVLVLYAKQQQQKIVDLDTISVCYAWALLESSFRYFLALCVIKEDKLKWSQVFCFLCVFFAFVSDLLILKTKQSVVMLKTIQKN